MGDKEGNPQYGGGVNEIGEKKELILPCMALTALGAKRLVAGKVIDLTFLSECSWVLRGGKGRWQIIKEGDLVKDGGLGVLYGCQGARPKRKDSLNEEGAQ